MKTPSPLRIAVLACTISTVMAQDPVADRSSDLRGGEIETRLTAIDWMATSGRKNADRLLVPLLADRDWEVQERAAIALRVLRSKNALRALIVLSVEGKVERIRLAAAVAVATIDAAEGAKAIWRRVKGKSSVAALRALAVVLRGQPRFSKADRLKRLVGSEIAAVREAAAAAWLEGAGDREGALRELLADQDLVVRCRALDAVTNAPRDEDLGPLSELLGAAQQNDVVTRRLLRALAATLVQHPGDRSARALAVLASAGDDGLILTRCARLAPLLVHGEDAVLDQRSATAALSPAIQSDDLGARRAAARALREIGGDEALKAALARFPKELDGRALVQLVETVAALRPPETPEAVGWLLHIVGGRFDREVRERAIISLGKLGVVGAVDGLTAVLGDPSWVIACCAAVSLGKTEDDAAGEPLLGLLSHPDWRLRGAGLVGLKHWSRPSAVEPVLDMLNDENLVVAYAAHEAMREMSRNYTLKPDAQAWRAWWGKAKGKHDFTSRQASIDKLRKYGYAVPDSEIYKGLDVVVLPGRNDHIEQILAKLSIDHRMLKPAFQDPARLGPGGIFVANCSGILSPQEVAEVAWFVCTGGSVFASCWALTNTLHEIHPGVVKKAATQAGVVGEVRIHAALPDSPLLNGVFPPAVAPIYHLFGSHLIEVLAPERCQVLIDSPEAAQRWGCGNLAVWFSSGHGLVFDSANHFDLQGFARSARLKSAKDRQAYAMDHMGMSFATWRATRSASYWKKQDKANANVPDRSAFRLLSNFVRSRRIGDG